MQYMDALLMGNIWFPTLIQLCEPILWCWNIYMKIHWLCERFIIRAHLPSTREFTKQTKCVLPYFVAFFYGMKWSRFSIKHNFQSKHILLITTTFGNNIVPICINTVQNPPEKHANTHTYTYLHFYWITVNEPEGKVLEGASLRIQSLCLQLLFEALYWNTIEKAPVRVA